LSACILSYSPLNSVWKNNRSTNASHNILDEAREISRAWPNTSIIITSRPLPVYSDIEENFQIKLLDQDKISTLIHLVSGIEKKPIEISYLPKPIRDAISRPFFTLIYAKVLQQNKDRRVYTTGELINTFINDAILFSDEKISKTLDLLENLASKSVDMDGAYIPWREICSITERNLLLETRLVDKDGETIGFPLPIISQWFAANGLVNGKVDIIEICENQKRLEGWLFPLVVFVSIFPHDVVSSVLTPVIAKNPGFASIIIRLGIADFSYDDSLQLPPALDCGKRIREVFKAWISGLGPISNFIAPLNQNGSLQSIGVSTGGNRLSVAWYCGDDKVDELIEIPDGEMKNYIHKPGWYRIRSGVTGTQPAWIWKWVFQELSESLDDFIIRKPFVLENGYMHKERIWQYALKAIGVGELNDEPIEINQLDRIVQERINLIENNQHTQWHDLNEYISRRKKEGEITLVAPWPRKDIELNRSGWLWEFYSDNQILKRARAIYTAALEEYENLVNSLFINLKQRMLIATLLPVKLHGQLYFHENQTWGRNPNMNWYFEPLEKGSKSEVDIRLVKQKEEQVDLKELLLLNQKMRPDSKAWISSFTSDMTMHIFGEKPLTDIVYKWLRDDLEKINWV